MKIKIAIFFLMILVSIFIVNNVIGLYVSRTRHGEIDISQGRLNYIGNIPEIRNDPVQIALKYLFYQTDYQDIIPARISINILKDNNEKIIIEIFDPNCQDDAIRTARDTIHLIRKNDTFIPVKHYYRFRYNPGYY